MGNLLRLLALVACLFASPAWAATGVELCPGQRAEVIQTHYLDWLRRLQNQPWLFQPVEPPGRPTAPISIKIENPEVAAPAVLPDTPLVRITR